MSDCQDQVRNLFGLSKEEKILDDFGCSIVETIPVPGQLYLSEHYICFGSNLFGFNRKISIAFNEIKELRRKKTYIEIETKNNPKKKYSFTSFNEIQIVYKRIKSMCRSYNENISITILDNQKKERETPIILSDSENSDNSEVCSDVENEDVTNATTGLTSKNVSSTNSNSSNEDCPQESNNIITGDKPNNIINNVINNNSNKNDIIDLNQSNSELKKSLTFNNFYEKKVKREEDIIQSQTCKNIILDSEDKTRRKLSTNSNKNEKKNNNNTQEDEEIKFNPIQEDLDHEVCRKVINMNPKMLFEKYQTSQNPETFYPKFYEWVGDYTEYKVPDWEKIENTENPELETFQRVETFWIVVRGVPLVNKSFVTKTLKYWIDKDGTYYIKTSSKSKGVPFCDCFLVETTIEYHPYMNNTKTVFRCYVRVNLIKSTFFKGTIISEGKRNFTIEINKWLEFIELKGEKVEGDYVYKPKKRKNSSGEKRRSLSHGVELERSLMKKEKHIVEFKDFCLDIFYGTKKYIKLSIDFFYREFDKKTRVILIVIFFVFIMLFSVIQGQNNQVKEIKNDIDDIKRILNNLTCIVSELKNQGK